jgi:hypothetical protein
MSNEFKHASVGTELTQAEYEAIGAHVLDGQVAGDMIVATSGSQLSRLASIKALAYLNAAVATMPGNKIARAHLTTIKAETSSPSNWTLGDIYPLATTVASGGNSTTIIDADVSPVFTDAKIKYARVDWTDGAGANAGSGYVTSVDSTTQLTIYKTAGANFVGNTGKYHITAGYYTIPETRWYQVFLQTYYSSNIADDRYLGGILVNGALAIYNAVQASHVSYVATPQSFPWYFTANDIVSLMAFHDNVADTVSIYGSSTPLTYLSFVGL